MLERNARAGGGCSTGEITLPGFLHDLGSSVYPMAIASPFYRSLPADIPWIEPAAPCAHPLDDGTAVLLHHSIEETVANLDAVDGRKYRSLFEPLVERFSELAEEILGPIAHIPERPFLLARFGLSALLPAASLARSRFAGTRARALFAGVAAHSVPPLEAPTSAAVALVLMAAGHAVGWPIVRGGGQTLTDILVRQLEFLGGRVETCHEVTQLPESDLVLADITPRQLIRIAGAELSSAYRGQLERFRYGAGAFKIDYALSSPIPWTAKECCGAATTILEGRSKRLQTRNARSTPRGPSFCSFSPHSSMRRERPKANILRGPIAMFPTGTIQIASKPLRARLNGSRRVSKIAFWPGLSHPCGVGTLEPEPGGRRSLGRRDESWSTVLSPDSFALSHVCAQPFSLRSIDSAGGRGAWHVRISHVAKAALRYLNSEARKK